MPSPDQIAELFLTHSAPDWKDLAKSFLTLASAVLVFSLTLSEKVIDFKLATLAERRVLLLAWALLFIAIISCGIAICFLSYAVEAASRQTLYTDSIYHGAFGFPFWRLAQTASTFLLVAGAMFTLALLTLIAAAWLAITRVGREGEKKETGSDSAANA